MCGIAGIINLDRGYRRLTIPLHQMTDRMKKRGPDDEGFVFIDQTKGKYFQYGGDDTPSINSARDNIPYLPSQHLFDENQIPTQIALGHRRLSIIDLSISGHQPLSDSTGNYWIVYNGEVYNYKEIKHELILLGHHFYSNSDTEVVLHSYIQWGVDCVDRFNGMFAFAVYDGVKKEILLFRDRIGIKPLYYTVQQNQFIFASDIKTIIASGLFKPDVNWEGLWHNLSFGIAPRPMTTFKDVFALKQASFIKIDLSSGRFSNKQYWQIPIGTQDRSMTESDAEGQLEEALIQSIKYRLVSDVKVGTFMSGGIDSTTVSAIASQFHPGINAFTLGYKSSLDRYDETEQAKETARMCDIDHIIDIVDPNNIIDYIDDMVSAYEEPFKALSPNYLISKLVAENKNKVVLNGLGGDELFAGYGYYNGKNLWEKSHRYRFILKHIPENIKGRFGRVRNLSSLTDISQFYSWSHSVFSESEKKDLFIDEFSFNSLDVLKEIYPTNKPFSDNIEALSYYDLMSYIANHHVYRVDQFTMNFSIEGRFPYLDHNLVELAFRIPSKFKIKDGQQKYLLKKVANKYIPSNCLMMPKKGFNLPLGEWINTKLFEFTDSMLISLKQRNIFDPGTVDMMWKQFKPEQYTKIWSLVMTELWFRKFIDKDGTVQ